MRWIILKIPVYIKVKYSKKLRHEMGCMMSKHSLKQNLIFYVIIFLGYYGCPLLIKDTGSGILLMLIVIPLICLITSIFYGIKNNFRYWYTLIVAIMFIPSIFIFYNSSAWIYTFVYGGFALIGNLMVLPFKKR